MSIFGGKITNGFTGSQYGVVPAFLDRALKFLEENVCLHLECNYAFEENYNNWCFFNSAY